MSGINFNDTDSKAVAGIFAQWNNGTDESTNLNTATYTAAPIFTQEAYGNYSSEFTKNSNTEIQVNFDGIVLFWANLGMQSAGTRVCISARTHKNGSTVGPRSSVTYIRNSGSGDSESSAIISPFYMPVVDGDTIDIRTINLANATDTTTFYGTNQNYVTILRVA